VSAFPAVYPGTCPICDERIAAGDPIVRDEGDYVHADCPDAFDAVITGQPCRQCWMVGPCDCEDPTR